jgi:hypothetical protein
MTRLASTLQYSGLRAARPLSGLTVAAPPSSILHPSIALSVLGQFCIQEGTAAWVKRLARQLELAELAAAAAAAAAAPAAAVGSAVHSVVAVASKRGGLFSALQPVVFQPTVTKSVVFIMTLVQSVAVVLTNYKGAPYMTPLAEVRTYTALFKMQR